MSIKKDKYFISLANNLAQNSLGYTGPNPSVGAVIVKKNEVMSFGSTSRTGRPHAEANALIKLSKHEKKNSTIYISLEPCSHYGKTAPCVNKIVGANIKRVVYSIDDVDARSSGKSYKILKKKKIIVKSNLLNKETRRIYKQYILSKKLNKPYVFGKLAISKDFYIKDKKNFYITNEQSLNTTHILRSKVNCILTTSKTVNADNPKLNCRIQGLEKFSPYIAILDKRLNIKKNSYLIKNAKRNKVYLFYHKYDDTKIKFLKSRKIRLIYTPLYKGNLDFNFILKKLYLLEISSVLVEGGKFLTISLLKNGFFNEFYLFLSSKKLKSRGIYKMKKIKSLLSSRFNNKKYNETFLEKDNLIHYY